MKGNQGGKRLYDVRKFKTNFPIISVITVVYNGRTHIERTIKSVADQRFMNVEYIVIDGGSTDGTIDIISRYERIIDYWVSEKDRGIYDAMNKGARLASDNSFLIFINSDDVLLDLGQLIGLLDSNIHAAFCSVVGRTTGSTSKLPFKIREYSAPLNETDLFSFKLHHQGLFIKKETFLELGGFDEIGLYTDRLLMANLIDNPKYNKLFCPDVTIAEYGLEGISNKYGLFRLKSFMSLMKQKRMSVVRLFRKKPYQFVKFLGSNFLGHKYLSWLKAKMAEGDER